MALEIRHILVPTDFSDTADHALRYALELAGALGADVHLLHAWQLSAYASPNSELAVGMERDLRRDLDALAQRYVASGVVIHPQLRLGPPTGELLDAATELDCGVIVMGTSGRTGFEHFILGSVAEQVARHARCPVLTIRHPEGT